MFYGKTVTLRYGNSLVTCVLYRESDGTWTSEYWKTGLFYYFPEIDKTKEKKTFPSLKEALIWLAENEMEKEYDWGKSERKTESGVECNS